MGKIMNTFSDISPEKWRHEIYSYEEYLQHKDAISNYLSLMNFGFIIEPRIRRDSKYPCWLKVLNNDNYPILYKEILIVDTMDLLLYHPTTMSWGFNFEKI